MTVKLPKPDIKNPIHFLAFGFGSGLAPKAPGTFGTIAGLGLYLLISQLGHMALVVSTVVICLTGSWICGRSSDLLKVHDHPGIVWDEFAGIFITLILFPVNWQYLLAGFLLFRLFDIWKPWPIRLADKQVHGGFGIMLDDLIAGVWAAITLYLLSQTEYFQPGYF